MGEPHLWAQWTYLVLVAAGLLLASNEHGKSKMLKRNFWGTAITTVIIMVILYFAGAFSLIL